MKLPELAINNYRFVVVILFLALISGTISMRSMPRSEDPVLNLPFYSIVVVQPGASASDIEELIANPIEEKLNEIEDLVEISSIIKDGHVKMKIEAGQNVNVDGKLEEIITQVNSIKSELPDNLYKLIIQKVNPLDVVIVQAALFSNQASSKELLDLAHQLEDQLLRVPGVRTVNLDGFQDQQVRIDLNLHKIASYQIPLEQIIKVLKSNNAIVPGGSINAGNKNFSIRTTGNFTSLHEIRETIVHSFNGKVVKLKDISNVFLDNEQEKYLTEFNGYPCGIISATQEKDVDVIATCQTIKETIAQFENGLPPHVKLTSLFDQGPVIETRISDFFFNLLQGILLVGIVILVFLGARNSLIIMTVIPTSILIAIYTLDISNYGLQQISIAGLVIALGLIVDNGIVIIENINRYLSMGFSKKDAAIKGTAEVGWAIISSTATTILAFYPMTQLGGRTGEYIKSLPLIIIYCLLASLLLAFILTPVLANFLVKVPKKKAPSLRMDRAMKKITDTLYHRLISWSIYNPGKVLTLTILGVAGSVFLFKEVGVSFFPAADKPILLADITLDEDSNLESTKNVCEEIKNELEKHNAIRDYCLNIGHGNPKIYYNLFPRSYNKNYAQFIVSFNEWNRTEFDSIYSLLNTRFNKIKDANIVLSELKNGPPYEAPVAIKIIGPNPEEINTVAFQVENIMESTTGTRNVNNPANEKKLELAVNINKAKASMLGVVPSDIELNVHTLTCGTNIGNSRFDDGNNYDLVLSTHFERNEPGIEDLSKLAIASRATQKYIPFRQIADLQLQQTNSYIEHYNTERTITVTSDLQKGVNSLGVTEEIIKKLDKLNLPWNVKLHIGGEYESSKKSFGGLADKLIIAVLGIFAVLVLQFRSFSQPMVVLSAIPLAFTGSIIALYFANLTFSFLAFIGFTSLIGIVVNTSIVLVDYTNQLIKQGKRVEDAIIEAAKVRFTPIVLTALTTILGLVPLTLSGSSLWAPLGWTIIGGMISSTTLTLVIVPVLFKLFTRKKKQQYVLD